MTILGLHEVSVEKDSDSLCWRIIDPGNNSIIYVISFSRAFQPDRINSKDLFNALLTALNTFPLTEDDIKRTKEKFRSLQSRSPLEAGNKSHKKVKYENNYSSNEEEIEEALSKVGKSNQVIKKGRKIF